MHGNLWQFCNESYDKEFYARSPKVDPRNTKKTPLRAVRGGSWHNGALEARSAMRSTWTGDTYVHYNYGFRRPRIWTENLHPPLLNIPGTSLAAPGRVVPGAVTGGGAIG